VKDHLGTVRALVDASGTNVVEAYHFDAWGRVTAYNGAGVELLASAIGNRYLFQGREFSWASGLYYFRARWYDPVTGRWLSNDPIGVSGGLNQYRALRCSPIEHVDRDGRRVEHFGSVSVFDIARFDAAMASLSEHGGTVGKALVRAARDESTTVEVFWGSDGPMAARGRGVSTLWLVRSGRLFGAEEDEDCPLRIDESTSRPEVVLAHELSHSLVGLDDPHNVDLVENAVRLSCGEALRTTYRGLPICLGRYDRPRFLDEALLRDFLRSNPDRVLP
jgi:RHS repeat-associated protein